MWGQITEEVPEKSHETRVPQTLRHMPVLSARVCRGNFTGMSLLVYKVT